MSFEDTQSQKPIRAIIRRGFLGRALFHNAHEAPDGQYVIDFDHPAQVISPWHSPNAIKVLYDSDVRHLGLHYIGKSERLLGIPLNTDDSVLAVPGKPIFDLLVRTYGFIGHGVVPYPQDEIPMLDIRYDRRDEDQLRIAITHQHIGEE